MTAAVQSPSKVVPDHSTVTTRPNVTANCVALETCTKCLDAAPDCSWSLVRQSCNNTVATEQQLMENESDDGHHHPPSQAVVDIRSCPRLTVTNQKYGTFYSTHRTVNVLVANDPNGRLRELLLRSNVTCHMNDMVYAGQVEDGGRKITCVSDLTEVVDTLESSTVYFVVTMNGVPLSFENMLDHYLESFKSRDTCDDEQSPSDECKLCLWQHDVYQYYCQWCPASNTCTGSYQHCDVRQLNAPASVVSLPDVVIRCPEVKIESITPRYGSWAGGTTMRIVIKNHKILAEKRVTVVKVADSRCLLPTVSMDGTTIMCTIPPSNSSELKEGPVEVTYKSEADLEDRPLSLPTYTLRSNQTFYFVEPVITSMTPACGPITGGTRVTIRGQFLDAGKTIRVYMRENITCAVQSHTQNEMTCVTGPSDQPATGRVRLEFDHYLSKYVHDPPFAYTSAPVLEAGQIFRGIAAGGTRLPVRGHNFACIHNPLVHIEYNGIHYTGGCVVHNDTYMVCTAPTINRPAPHQVAALRFGFLADYNDTTVHIPLPDATPDYTLYPDPVYTYFETDGGRSVTVYGLNLDLGYDVADLSVMFHKANVPCNVTSVQSDRIVCLPPKQLMDDHYDYGGDDYGDGNDYADLPLALVNEDIRVTVGNLVYELKGKDQMPRHTNSLRINTIIFGGIAIVSLVITIVAAVVYCAKIVMTVSTQQTEMRSLCEHLNDTTATEAGCTVNESCEDSSSSPALSKDEQEKNI